MYHWKQIWIICSSIIVVSEYCKSVAFASSHCFDFSFCGTVSGSCKSSLSYTDDKVNGNADKKRRKRLKITSI